MRSQGFLFTLWVSGGVVVFAQLCFCVRKRRRHDRYGRASGECCKSCHFWRFKPCATSFRVTGVALCDIPTFFITRQKSFCVTVTRLLHRFQKLTCTLRGRCSTLDVSMFILRGRSSSLDVSCCAIFAHRIARAASGGDNVRILCQAWDFATCDEH